MVTGLSIRVINTVCFSFAVRLCFGFDPVSAPVMSLGSHPLVC